MTDRRNCRRKRRSGRRRKAGLVSGQHFLVTTQVIRAGSASFLPLFSFPAFFSLSSSAYLIASNSGLQLFFLLKKTLELPTYISLASFLPYLTHIVSTSTKIRRKSVFIFAKTKSSPPPTSSSFKKNSIHHDTNSSVPTLFIPTFYSFFCTTHLAYINKKCLICTQ